MPKNKKHEDSQEALNEYEEKYKRALADYQNLEKRVQSQKSEWIKTSNKDLILKLLPGIDSLTLAERHTQDAGVKLSIDHFLDILAQEGVEKIDTIGKIFDPHLMEAVSTKPGEEGKVIEETKAGYTLNGEVLRPAQVIVGKGEN